MIKEKYIFTGGLDSDSDFSVIPKGNYTNALNVRITVAPDGAMASIKNVPSNEEVTYSLPEGTNQVIGSAEDLERQRLIYFIHNSLGDDLILCYTLSDNSVTTLLRNDDVNSDLNFNPSYQIQAKVVGDQIYWTDSLNRPRKLNIERGRKTYQSNYVSADGSSPRAYSLPLAETDITLAKRPPIFPLVAVESNTSQTNNFLKLESFQFAYRYVYRDNEISVLSPYSNIILPQDDDTEEPNDTITVNLSNSESFDNEVDKVQFLVRNGNIGDWSIIREINRTDNPTDFSEQNSGSSYSFEFYNRIAGRSVAREETARTFDYVPLTAKTLEAAKSRIFLGNIKEGYDPTSVGLTASLTTQEVDSEAVPVTGDWVYLGSDCKTGGIFGSTKVIEQMLVVINAGSAVDGFYKVPNNPYLQQYKEGNLDSEVTLSPDDFVTDLDDFFVSAEGKETKRDELTDTLINPSCSGNLSNDKIILGSDLGDPQPTVYGIGSSIAVASGLRQMKSNSTYQLGLVFFDEFLQNSGVLTNDNAIVQTQIRDFSQSNFDSAIRWTIDPAATTIPSWAKYYSIVRTKSLNVQSFVQHFSNALKYYSTSASSTSDSTVFTYADTYTENETEGLAINISRLAKDGLGYSFTEGDLVDIFFSDNEKRTYQIAGISGPYILTVESEDFGDLSNGGNVKSTCLFEIRTPRVNRLDEPYYEVGSLYEIDNGAFTTTTGVINGDVTVKLRSSDESNEAAVKYILENMSRNDQRSNDWVTDIGRVNVRLFNGGQEVLPTTIRYSNSWIQGTMVNGLSSFDLLDSNNVPQENGPIQKLVLTNRTQDHGSVMLGISTNETASIYLGQTQTLDNNGNSVILSSGKVIGTINNLNGSYGTLHPESVARNEGQVYWYDVLNGEIVQYSANGLFGASSAYKMSKFVKDVSRTIAKGSHIIPGSYDPYADEYLLVFPAASTEKGTKFLKDVNATVSSYYYGQKFKTFDGYSEVTQFGKQALGEVVKGETYTLTVDINPKIDEEDRRVYIYIDDGLILNFESDEVLSFIPNRSGTLYAGIYMSVGVKLSKPAVNEHEANLYTTRTLAFSPSGRKFTTFYSFAPEHGNRVGDHFFTFDEGKCYKHLIAGGYNQFYGVTYKSLLGFIVNENPQVVKELRSLSFEGSTPPDYVHFRNVYPYEQSSDLVASDFNSRESIHDGAVLRDRLDPNQVSVDEALYKGAFMRAQFPQIYFEITDIDDQFILRFVDVNYTISSGHTNIA